MTLLLLVHLPLALAGVALAPRRLLTWVLVLGVLVIATRDRHRGRQEVERPLLVQVPRR